MDRDANAPTAGHAKRPKTHRQRKNVGNDELGKGGLTVISLHVLAVDRAYLPIQGSAAASLVMEEKEQMPHNGIVELPATPNRQFDHY